MKSAKGASGPRQNFIEDGSPRMKRRITEGEVMLNYELELSSDRILSVLAYSEGYKYQRRYHFRIWPWTDIDMKINRIKKHAEILRDQAGSEEK